MPKPRKDKEMVYMGFAKRFEERSVAYSKIGKNNLKRNSECEDVIYVEETSEMKFWGLADGQSGKKCCRKGGKEVLKAVFRFVADKGITQMTQYEHVDELQYELIRTIRDTISELAATDGVEKTEYSSTLVVLACDTLTGNYVLIHLGDGGIIGQKADGGIRMLSAPENGLTANYTWLTTSSDALYHLRLSFGNVKAYSRIVMITDGATVYAYGRNITESAKHMIASGNREELVSFLDSSDPSDDASCIVVDFS